MPEAGNDAEEENEDGIVGQRTEMQGVFVLATVMRDGAVSGEQPDEGIPNEDCARTDFRVSKRRLYMYKSSPK